MQVRSLTFAVVAGGLGVTAAMAVVRPSGVAYETPRLHVALVTAEAGIALLAALLVAGRLRGERRLDHLLLALGLGTLAVANVLFAALPAVVWGEFPSFVAWAGLGARFAGYTMLAAAATASARHVRFDGRRARATVAGVVAAHLVLAGLALWLEPVLPRATSASEVDAALLVEAHAVAIGAQVLGAVLFLLAAAGFSRRAERTGDALMWGMAIACAWGVVARVNFVLYPSMFTDFVSLGDLFRLLFYAAVLAAAVVEIERRRADADEAAALHERRRIARDLHDGLAQELSSIRRNLAWLDPDDEAVKRARAGCDRALADARRAIAALRDPVDRPFAASLAETADRVAVREGTSVTVNVWSPLSVTRAQHDALLLIASEAITNAARHGHAKSVTVELRGGREAKLEISDTGSGFDLRRAGPGFGLAGMAERARLVGGRLHIESAPGAGTRVVVGL